MISCHILVRLQLYIYKLKEREIHEAVKLVVMLDLFLKHNSAFEFYTGYNP